MYRDTLSLKIDPARCSGCGYCVRECVNDVLTLDPETKRPEVKPGGEARCIHCAHCLMACPSGAFSMDGIDPDNCPAPGKTLPDFDSLLTLVRNRRSIRHWQDRDVEREKLEKLLDAMRYPPTAVNYRNLFFSVIETSEKMNRFREAFYREFFERFPESDEAVSWKQARQNGRDIVFRDAPHLIVAAYDENSFRGQVDCVIALTQFEMLANAMGVGTVWFGRILIVMEKFMPELADKLGIPAGFRPGYAMLFGYPAAKFHRTIQRDLPRVVFPG